VTVSVYSLLNYKPKLGWREGENSGKDRITLSRIVSTRGATLNSVVAVCVLRVRRREYSISGSRRDTKDDTRRM